MSSINCNKKFKILDSIAYTYFPDDNWGTKGNSVFKKIKENGESIKPCLIERVLDTTKSEFRVHPKIPDASTKGIWVNADNGKAIQVEKGVFLRAYHKYQWNDNL